MNARNVATASNPPQPRIRPGPRKKEARIIQWLLFVKAILLVSLLAQRLYQIDIVQQLQARELTPRQADSLLVGSGWGLAEVPNVMITFTIWILLVWWVEKLSTVLTLMTPGKQLRSRYLAITSWLLPGIWTIGPRITLSRIWTASRTSETTGQRHPILLDLAWALYHGAMIIGYIVSARILASWYPANNDIAVYNNLHIPFGSESLSVAFSVAAISGCLLMIPAVGTIGRRFEARRVEYLRTP